MTAKRLNIAAEPRVLAMCGSLLAAGWGMFWTGRALSLSGRLDFRHGILIAYFFAAAIALLRGLKSKEIPVVRKWWILLALIGAREIYAPESPALRAMSFASAVAVFIVGVRVESLRTKGKDGGGEAQ